MLRDDGSQLALGPRPSRILATLLLSADQVVPVSELIDAVWDDSPPTTARRQVHNCIYLLRKEICISAEGPGYRLSVQDGQFDASAFEEHTARALTLAAAGDAALALEALTAGLSLWRGAACTGRTIEAAAARLDEQRIAAIERKCDLELELGRHRDVVGELTELVAVHPLREGLVGLLMRALHGSGRQAEALTAYEVLRTRLADELGLDPSATLRRLQTFVLRDEIVPRQLPKQVRFFAGRTAEIERLSALDLGNNAEVVAIVGTAGVGKTDTGL